MLFLGFFNLRKGACPKRTFSLDWQPKPGREAKENYFLCGQALNNSECLAPRGCQLLDQGTPLENYKIFLKKTKTIINKKR